MVAYSLHSKNASSASASGSVMAVISDAILCVIGCSDVNGESIYNTMPWRVQNDTAAELVWYTAAKAQPVC